MPLESLHYNNYAIIIRINLYLHTLEAEKQLVTNEQYNRINYVINNRELQDYNFLQSFLIFVEVRGVSGNLRVENYPNHNCRIDQLDQHHQVDGQEYFEETAFKDWVVFVGHVYEKGGKENKLPNLLVNSEMLIF